MIVIDMDKLWIPSGKRGPPKPRSSQDPPVSSTSSTSSKPVIPERKKEGGSSPHDALSPNLVDMETHPNEPASTKSSGFRSIPETQGSGLPTSKMQRSNSYSAEVQVSSNHDSPSDLLPPFHEYGHPVTSTISSSSSTSSSSNGKRSSEPASHQDDISFSPEEDDLTETPSAKTKAVSKSLAGFVDEVTDSDGDNNRGNNPQKKLPPVRVPPKKPLSLSSTSVHNNNNNATNDDGYSSWADEKSRKQAPPIQQTQYLGGTAPSGPKQGIQGFPFPFPLQTPNKHTKQKHL